MRLDEVLAILQAHIDELRSRNVRSLSVFGSVARDEATAESDVDLLIEFEEGAVVGLFEFIRLQHYLQDILGCKVDLKTLGGLRRKIREHILSEAVRAA